MLNSLDTFSILCSLALLMPLENSLHPEAIIAPGAAIGDTSINVGLMVWVKEAFNQKNIRASFIITIGRAVGKTIIRMNRMQLWFNNNVEGGEGGEPPHQQVTNAIVAPHDVTACAAGLSMLKGEGLLAFASTERRKTFHRKQVPNCHKSFH